MLLHWQNWGYKNVIQNIVKIKKRDGLTDGLKNKIDIFFATGRITEEQYDELMDIKKEEKTKGGK